MRPTGLETGWPFFRCGDGERQADSTGLLRRGGGATGDEPMLLFAPVDGGKEMRKHRSTAVLLVGFIAGFALCVGKSASLFGQTKDKETTAKRIAIRAGRLIDGKSDTPVAGALIVIEGDKIVSVTAGGSAPAGVETIDLSKATVLPGFVDVHTHVLLNADFTGEDYDAQLLKESIPYRAILAARNARIALDHGFTTIRDLETEGAMYADVDVKTAIANGEVSGPRMRG